MNTILASRTLLVCVGSALCASTASAVAACGGNRSDGFEVPGATGDAQNGEDAGDDSGRSASSSSSGAAPGSGPVFTGDDASSLANASSSDCKPGTYSGPFATKVVVGDAGPTALSLAWNGTLTVTLVGQAVMTGSSENLSPTLTIAPGGRMDGTDNFNGVFGADVTGQLDCPSKTLQATIANGIYMILGDGGSTLPFTGTVDGTYVPATPPALMGSMYIATSPGLLGALGATGTVTATMQ